MTTQLLREILDSVRDDLEILGMEEVMTEGEEVPDAVECAAIERVEGMLQSGADALLREVEEIADHDAGLTAGLAGQPNDDTKSAIWQRGWADAQE